jgi:hypothetical protein
MSARWCGAPPGEEWTAASEFSRRGKVERREERKQKPEI